jgi:hypothetical protein
MPSHKRVAAISIFITVGSPNRARVRTMIPVPLFPYPPVARTPDIGTADPHVIRPRDWSFNINFRRWRRAGDHDVGVWSAHAQIAARHENRGNHWNCDGCQKFGFHNVLFSPVLFKSAFPSWDCSFPLNWRPFS